VKTYHWPEMIPYEDWGEPDCFRLGDNVWVERTLEVNGLTSRMWLVAPVGMLLDGASIPRLFWLLIGSPFVGEYRWPSIFHDAGYSGELILFQQMGDELVEVTGIMDKVWIDTEFKDMMESRGVGIVRRQAMYKAVKKFGRMERKEA